MSMNVFDRAPEDVSDSAANTDILYHFTVESRFCEILYSNCLKGFEHNRYPFDGSSAKQVYFTQNKDLITGGIPLREGINCGSALNAARLHSQYKIKAHIDMQLKEYYPDLAEGAYSVEVDAITSLDRYVDHLIIFPSFCKRLHHLPIHLSLLDQACFDKNKESFRDIDLASWCWEPSLDLPEILKLLGTRYGVNSQR